MLPPGAGWRAITTPLSLALVALIAAVALWVAVTDAENPSRVAEFSGAIEVTAVNLPEGQAVASYSSPTVTLRIRADENVFSRLAVSDFRVYVDLAGVRQTTTDQRLFARVVGRDDVEIVDVNPQVVTVTLEPAVTRQVPVQPHLVGTPAQGFSVPAGGVESTPGTVRVTGAASLVQLVASASADINLTGLRASLQQLYTLVPRDSRGADLRGLSFDPPNAEIKVEVLQEEVTLSLTIVPQVQGVVAEGYNLVGVSVDPPAIAVSGPLELLQAVSFLNTEPVDVGGLRNDGTRNVRLRLPAGLQATRDTVSVRLKVVPAPGEVALAVAPQVSGTGEGLKATLQTSSLLVRVGGEMPALRNLQPGAIRATVSLAGLGEGVHVLQPSISLPEGLKLVSTDPSQVVVVISR